MLRFASAEPMDWKAALLGAKMVTSRAVSTVLVRLVALSAPAREVKLAAMAVEETFNGI